MENLEFKPLFYFREYLYQHSNEKNSENCKGEIKISRAPHRIEL
jgi:hypothetical protein